MNILLLSAYDAASHRSWREGLVSAFPEHSFTQFTLPPRYFSWRIRGNSLSFADSLKACDTRFDLLIATSMVDLSTLIGIAPRLAGVPSLLYFHENQFAFPESERAFASIEPKMVNLFSAMAASKLCFNSTYNLDSFCEGGERMLARFPDAVPPNIITDIRHKSSVLPVPLPDDTFNVAKQKYMGKERSVVWNHRWEYDKGPERLLALICNLPKELNITFHVVGQRFKKMPKEMDEIKSRLSACGWLGEWGPIDTREDYLRLLAASDFVLSTAIHDFQGLAVLEAMALGCTPIVPDRLAYRDYVDGEFRYASHIDHIDTEAVHAVQKFNERLLSLGRTVKPEFAVARNLNWATLKPRYQSIFDELVADVRSDNK